MRQTKSKIEKTSLVTCDACGAGMVEKWGRFGMFMCCSRYPKCKNTLSGQRLEEWFEQNYPSLYPGNEF